MQVLSSRSNQTQRSNSFSKNNKKGLSLTSRTKCNSLPKPSHQFLQEQTIETDRRNNNQTQISIKFDTQNHFQQSSFFSVPQNQNPFSSNQNCTSYLSEKPILQKPRITFRYSNDHNSQNQVIYRQNLFQKNDASEPLHPSQIRNRFLPSQELRNIVVTKSIETKNANQISQMTEKQQNINKILIDSKQIDREIIQQQVYQSFSTVTQNIPSYPQITVNPLYFENKPQQRQKCQDIEKNNVFLEQNQSPYHLLISTAKKCQSKQLSPYIIQESQVNEVSKTKNLPQIEQFHINQVVFEENQQDSPSTSQVFDKILQQKNQLQLIQKQDIIQMKTQLSKKTEEKSQVFKVHSKNNFQKQQKIDNKNLVNKSPQKVIEVKNLQKSPKKILKKNIPNNILADIENRPPESHSNSFLSGRRNIKRFKQIEKRLQEIITICGKNL